jgi:uncharacterized membrane protein YbhN (UPF0104 family)
VWRDVRGSARTGPPMRLEGRLSRRVLCTVLLGLTSVGLLLWVAPPEAVIKQIGEMNLGWVVAAIALELGSCVSYVIVFRRFFPEPPPSVGRRVAWIAMGAGAVLPGGNISSAAATGWLLRRHGIGTRRLLGRCAALLCLLTAFGFFVNGLAGVLLLAGVAGGPHDLLHTGGPILVSIAVLASGALLPMAARRVGERAPPQVRGFAAGLESAWRSFGAPHWRLIGTAGFLCLDMAALWAACAATGHPIGFLALAIAYCIGYLTTTVPIPAGLGVLDAGLAASLVLYGLSPSASVSAVIVYHSIAIWVPGVGGLLAWLPTRGRRSLAPPTVSLPALGAVAAATDPDG